MADERKDKKVKTIPVIPETENLRLLGRMDETQRPLCLDWTGSGLEVNFRGSDLWAELEAPEKAPVFWMIVLADGSPVARFPVEPGIRFYPLLLGMEADKARTVTLMKETQCMPQTPKATVRIHSLRMEGELLALKPYDFRVEFVGDSLTSGEGALAPRDNEEWVGAWFTARGNYAWYACRAIHAEMRLLSQSGYGVCWNYEHRPEENMSDGYEKTVGVLFGKEAEARGCRTDYDFSRKPADAVCIRLATNDAGGMRHAESYPTDGPAVTEGCLRMIRKVRQYNPKAKIVWILPDTGCWPELAGKAVSLAAEEGLKEVYSFTLPDYTPEDYGARCHPNARWNAKAGELLGAYLKQLLA